MSAQQIWFDSEQFSGTRSLLHWWKNVYNTELPPRGFIYIVHGMGEHGGRYDEFARYFTNIGFDVLAPDLPGHGRSKSEGAQNRCYTMEELTEEARLIYRKFMLEGPIAKQAPLRQPWYLVGHSMGGLIGLNWIVSGKKPIEEGEFAQKAFISAPPLKLRLAVPAWKIFLSNALIKVAPDLQIANGIDPVMLSYDVANQSRYRNDQLVHHFSSPRQFQSLTETITRVIEFAKNVEIPVFLAVGSDDPIIDPQGIKDYYNLLGTHKKLLEIPNARHEILNETNRDVLYRELAAWIA